MISRRSQSLLLLVVVWAISAAMLVQRIDRGWIPHDEGLIGHTAERVLAGELPHRDFDDVYTGGLAYLNAGAIRALGVNIRSPRIVLVAAFLLCVPAIFYAATRFVSPLGAAAATLLGVAWSLPNYVAALPSWYNLIFAMFGLAALLRFVDTENTRWLFAAGVCGGLSFLMKLVGVYYIAGVLLYLVYREQEGAPAVAQHGDTSPADARPSVYQLVVMAGLLAFVLGLVLLVASSPGPDYVINFVIPGASVAVALLWDERRAGRQRVPSGDRFRALARLALPFALGVVIPVAVFLVPYLASHALGDFVRGVFINPSRRLAFAAMPPLPWTYGLPTICVVTVLLASGWLGRSRSMLLGIVLAASGAYVVLAAGFSAETYRSFFYSAVLFPTVAVVIAMGIVCGTKDRPSLERQRLFIVASGVALFALVQFPFAAPIYFCYVTPMLALLVAGIVSGLRVRSPAIPAVLATTYFAFAVLRLNPGFIYFMGRKYEPYQPLVSLDFTRGGGVRVPRPASNAYDRLVKVVREHAGGSGAYIYAAPDAPEVYFLTGLRNPTRTLYDFFADDENRGATRLLHNLREHDVRVVAINRVPQFSPPVAGDLRATLEREYPLGEAVGPFEVRWRQ